MQYVIDKIKEENGFDLTQNQRMLRRLRRTCKEAKESLSHDIEYFNFEVGF